ncbi:hypothetical protein MtrunA17_Chr5g0397111 [Medicago truncatula]|uniref:Uncharacterized protein n=1 Tax=Medicago truncatula TaxID=3880 RepID=A0A396HJU9_MEDTR|nr:hypothetical protein MtrunA17_Chr5g0397111 [Medicago truncatula]
MIADVIIQAVERKLSRGKSKQPCNASSSASEPSETGDVWST